MNVHRYPIWFNFLYLWMNYVVSVLSVAILLFVFHPTWLVILYAVALVGLILICERSLFRIFPTMIQIDNGQVLLFRHRKYAEFSLTDIVEVDSNATLPYAPLGERWTKVRFKNSSSSRVFYFAPYIESYAELVHELSEKVTSEHQPDIRVFAFTWGAIQKRRLGLLMVAIFLAAVTGHVITSVKSPIALAAALIGILSFGSFFVWVCVTPPVKVEFSDGQIIFGFLFGRKLQVDRHDVLGAKKIGNSLSLILNNGRKVFLSSEFKDFHKLASHFKRIDSKSH